MIIRKGFLSILAVFLIAFLATGCVFGPKEDVGTEDIDPPQTHYGEGEDSSEVVFEFDETDDKGEKGEKGERDENASSTLTEEGSGAVDRKLYLFDQQGYVVSVTLPLPHTESVAKQALEYLVEDGPITQMLPNGMRAVLPAGTELTVDVKEDGTAIVDFSPEFKNYRAEDEKGILEAITWTLTEFDSIDQVKISINGYIEDKMPVNGTSISSPLSRKDGINIEVADGAQVGYNSAVTLYFMAQNPSDASDYFVPVTRMIQRTDDLLTATVEQFIAGPKQGSGLVSGIIPSTNLLEANVDGDLLTLNFDETFLQYTQDESKASDDAILSLVLSLTESGPVERVQFMVEGNQQLMTVKGTDLSQPVSRSFVVKSTGF